MSRPIVHLILDGVVLRVKSSRNFQDQLFSNLRYFLLFQGDWVHFPRSLSMWLLGVQQKKKARETAAKNSWIVEKTREIASNFLVIKKEESVISSIYSIKAFTVINVCYINASPMFEDSGSSILKSMNPTRHKGCT